MNLEEQINKAISENLPAQLGGALRQRLESLEKIEKDFKSLKTHYESQETTLKNKEDKIKTLEVQIKLQDDLIKKEKELIDREIKLELTLAFERLNNATQMNSNILELSRLVFKNKSVNETIFKSDYVPVSQNGFTDLRRIDISQNKSTSQE